MVKVSWLSKRSHTDPPFDDSAAESWATELFIAEREFYTWERGFRPVRRALAQQAPQAQWIAMDQLRRVCIVFALVAFVLAFLTGAVLFFIIEPPILVRIFVALSAIAIGCFALAGIAAYFEE